MGQSWEAGRWGIATRSACRSRGWKAPAVGAGPVSEGMEAGSEILRTRRKPQGGVTNRAGEMAIAPMECRDGSARAVRSSSSPAQVGSHVERGVLPSVRGHDRHGSHRAAGTPHILKGNADEEEFLSPRLREVLEQHVFNYVDAGAYQ